MEIRAQVHIGTLPTQLLFSVIRLIIHFVLDETCVGVILMIKKDKKKKKNKQNTWFRIRWMCLRVRGYT